MGFATFQMRLQLNFDNNESWLNKTVESLEQNPNAPSGNHRIPNSLMDANGDLRIGEEGNNFIQANNVNTNARIQDVWAYNMWEEMEKIRDLIKEKYNYIAMDTEFPGVVAKPIGIFENTGNYLYNLLKCNVDLLRIIQLGITLFDSEGRLPKTGHTTWQFNFKFNLTEDMYAQDSIELLTNSKIQFKRHEEDGIDPFEFSALLVPSGMVLSDEVYWVTFHSNFDFGYMIKLLTDMPLPEEENEFFEYLHMFFPKVYDIKYLMKSCKNLKGGLQEISDQLDLTRIGLQHQAGSDAWLTGMAFFKIRDLYFEGIIDDSKYCGQLYGLGLLSDGGNRFGEAVENHAL